jgi:hypothetical protein
MKRRGANEKASLMLTTRLVLAACLLFGLSAVAARAVEPAKLPTPQADLGVLLDTIRANRKALISVNLALSKEEAEKFWPLYDQYQHEISVIGDRMVAIIEDYTANFRTLSDDKALQLVNDYLAAEADRLAVRRKYVDQFAKILPGRTVARFYQIENKMDAVLRYDLAATIPVVDEVPAASTK